MTLSPLLDADPVIQIHVYTAIAALILGGAILFRRKGTTTHKLYGKLWAGLMLVTALSSFLIHELRVWGNYSPIHLLSVFSLASLVYAILKVRRGNISAHARALKGLYIGGLVVAGVFSFMPGRIMYRMLFEDSGGYVLTAWQAITIGLLGAVVVFVYGLVKKQSDSNITRV